MTIRTTAILWLLAGLLTANGLRAQSAADTILTYEEFEQLILTNHPIAKIADMRPELGEIERLGAWGRFDPVVDIDWFGKMFDGKEYYDILDAQVKVPTFAGLSVTGGYLNTTGEFLNPERNTDVNGLWSIGLESNLLQGLTFDERRAALQRARVVQSLTFTQRRLLLNRLLTEGYEAYISWQAYYETREIILESIDLAEEYLYATRESYIQGDKPAIDTLEAFLILQDRISMLQNNDVDLVKARQMVESFIWGPSEPQQLLPDTDPQDIEQYEATIMLPNTLDDVLLLHPDLLEKEFKLRELDIERRLKRQKLLPKLKLKANLLIATNNETSLPVEYDLGNYNYGIGFSMPILLREARAGLQLTDFKIATIELELEAKRNELRNKIDAIIQQQEILQDQIALQRRNVINYRELLEAEQIKFEFGESSVFLLNSRQEKFIDARIKLVKAIAEGRMNQIMYRFLTNQFFMEPLERPAPR